VNTISIVLPPLRERAVDIPLLANAFLAQFGGTHPPRLSEDAMRALQAYRWPGNVRELRNVMERAVLLANGGVIQARDLPLHDTQVAARSTNGEDVSLAELERRHIESVLSRTNWHQGRAATVLGISSKTLYRKIREYGFHRPRAANSG
jgi:DNA-binding NtrC family response regulator